MQGIPPPAARHLPMGQPPAGVGAPPDGLDQPEPHGSLKQETDETSATKDAQANSKNDKGALLGKRK